MIGRTLDELYCEHLAIAHMWLRLLRRVPHTSRQHAVTLSRVAAARRAAIAVKQTIEMVERNERHRLAQ